MDSGIISEPGFEACVVDYRGMAYGIVPVRGTDEAAAVVYVTEIRVENVVAGMERENPSAEYYIESVLIGIVGDSLVAGQPVETLPADVAFAIARHVDEQHPRVEIWSSVIEAEA